MEQAALPKPRFRVERGIIVLDAVDAVEAVIAVESSDVMDSVDRLILETLQRAKEF